MKCIPIVCLFFLFSCGETAQPVKIETSSPGKAEPHPQAILSEDGIRYTEFEPEQIKTLHIQGFDLWRAYTFLSNKIAIGHYESVDGEITPPDSENNYGMRLMLLDKSNHILFKSRGGQDVYMYEPHFFKNATNNKVIIICQLAFEYNCGGEAFVLENGKMKQIGYLNIESNKEDQSLVEIIQINEKKGHLIFTFDKDSLLLDPGGKGERFIPNNNVRYVYEHQKLKLYK